MCAGEGREFVRLGLGERGGDELGRDVTFFIIPVNRHVRSGLGVRQRGDIPAFLLENVI